jgi:hypothetical protein
MEVFNSFCHLKPSEGSASVRSVKRCINGDAVGNINSALLKNLDTHQTHGEQNRQPGPLIAPVNKHRS